MQETTMVLSRRKLSQIIGMGRKSSTKDETKHADRKFEKKLEFYTKVRETVAIGAQKTIKKKTKLRSRHKKLKAYNLSSLAEVLPNFEPSKQPTPADFKVTSKSRQKLVMKETNQFKTVVNDPVFKADPLVALHQHLQSTQPFSNEKPARKKKSGKKKKRSKTPIEPQSMEE